MPHLETNAPRRALRHPALFATQRRAPAAVAQLQRRSHVLTSVAVPAALPPVWQLQDVGVGQLTLSFSAHAGELVHLRGGSPVARLRVLDMAAGFAPAASGRCDILGHDTQALDGDARRQLRLRHIACVLAGDHLLASPEAPATVVQAHVAQPLLQQGVTAPLALARARRALDLLGAGDLAHCTPPMLSAGQARLVLLARATVTQPLLLVLEQPEDGLAPPALAAVRQALWALAHDVGTCIVMTTHHAPLMASADQVLDLDAAPAPTHTFDAAGGQRGVVA